MLRRRASSSRYELILVVSASDLKHHKLASTGYRCRVSEIGVAGSFSAPRFNSAAYVTSVPFETRCPLGYGPNVFHGIVKPNSATVRLPYGDNKPDEADVRAYAIFFYNVFANGIAELTCGDLESVDYEVVIPVNMMMTVSADKAVQEAVGRFRKEQSA
jgi:hypothetical protein